LTRKPETKESPGPASHEVIEAGRLWRSHGAEDVYFQREAQVNLWTVMGGIAAAALLTQFFGLVQEVQASRWYLVLYFLASIGAIVNSWEQTAWGSLVLRWPISIPVTVLIFLTQLSLDIQCLLVTKPMGWMAASGLLILFSLLHNNYNRLSGAWPDYSPGRLKEIRASWTIYTCWLLLCVGAVLQLHWFPSRLTEIIWGFVVLASSVIALVMQHRTTERERKELGIP
jgi:cytochrome c oxidase subunit IV